MVVSLQTRDFFIFQMRRKSNTQTVFLDNGIYGQNI